MRNSKMKNIYFIIDQDYMLNINRMSTGRKDINNRMHQTKLQECTTEHKYQHWGMSRKTSCYMYRI